VIQILCRRRKNNPCWSVRRASEKRRLPKGWRYVSSNRSAGYLAKCSGVFSIWAHYWPEPNIAVILSSVSRVFSTVEETPNGILFIDEIHTIIGAGSASVERWTHPIC
jgi:ATP-dependent Clp protease ATP-binding subunit ClpA